MAEINEGPVALSMINGNSERKYQNFDFKNKEVENSRLIISSLLFYISLLKLTYVDLKSLSRVNLDVGKKIYEK